MFYIFAQTTFLTNENNSYSAANDNNMINNINDKT